jgi:hypothetical protein
MEGNALSQNTLLDRQWSFAMMCWERFCNMADGFWTFLQEALQSNSKSTVLKGLGWLLLILTAGAIAGSHYGAEQWFVTALEPVLNFCQTKC